MADEKNKDKDLQRKAFMLGAWKPTPQVQAFLNANPTIKERVLGDLEQRKLEFETLSEEYDILHKIENQRRKQAVEQVELLTQMRLQVDVDSQEHVRLTQELNMARRAALGDVNTNQQLTNMQNRMVSLLQGGDMDIDMENTVQVGGRRYSREKLQMLQNNPDTAQRVLERLQNEAERGNLQAQSDAKALANYLAEGITDRVVSETNVVPSEAVEEPEIESAAPSGFNRILTNIRERLMGTQGKGSLSTQPTGTQPAERVEATRRESLSERAEEIQRAKMIRIRGQRVETE